MDVVINAENKKKHFTINYSDFYISRVNNISEISKYANLRGQKRS